MGYFDFLISKDNIEPDANAEYIYLFHMVWGNEELESIPIKYGTIVHSVQKLPNNSFVFKIGTDEQIYKTNYGLISVS